MLGTSLFIIHIICKLFFHSVDCPFICISSLEKCLFRSSAHFLLDCLFFILNCMSCLNIWKLILCQLHHLHIFFSVV